jgi:cobalt-precorrin 5A hydrolase
MAIATNDNIAVWSVTANGLSIARRVARQWPGATLFASRKVAAVAGSAAVVPFYRLTDAVQDRFHRFAGHIFIMAAGIVVRAVAPVLKDKTIDPAVVVVDDCGRFAVSLISGHIGGANRLAMRVADVLGAAPVITTATDINQKPAIDVLAVDLGLAIENPERIKAVNMALLTDDPILLHDPCGWLADRLAGGAVVSAKQDRSLHKPDASSAGVWVDDVLGGEPAHALVLRPPSLIAGIGCNRNTPKEEIRAKLTEVMALASLSHRSLRAIASIDLKSDEVGLCALAAELELPLQFFTKDQLATVDNVPTPSDTVAKHIGVPSVCEAAALLASQNGRLIVPKQSTRNVTIAIARMASISSASVPEI